MATASKFVIVDLNKDLNLRIRPNISDIKMSISLENENSKAHIILLMAMTEDIENEFKVYEKIMDLWITLNERFGDMSLIK